MIGLVETRVAELETLFKELSRAEKLGDKELFKQAKLALKNTTVAKRNLITGLEVLVACGKRDFVELEKWR